MKNFDENTWIKSAFAVTLLLVCLPTILLFAVDTTRVQKLRNQVERVEKKSNTSGKLQQKDAPSLSKKASSKAFQHTHKGPIKWIEAEVAYQAYQKQEKPFFIDVYTDWCGWCKRMDATTFQDSVIADYLNRYFYPVKFDAERKDTINFRGQQYFNSQDAYVKKYLSSMDSLLTLQRDSLKRIGKDTNQVALADAIAQRIQTNGFNKQRMQRSARRTSHDFARDLMNDRMSYPTFVILFDSLKRNFPLKGFQKPNVLLSALTFMAEGVWRNTVNLEGYQNLFLSVYGASSKPKPALLDYKLVQAKLSKSEKKTVVLLTNPATYTSNIMELGVMNNPEVKAYLESNYNVCKLNIYDRDSVLFGGKKYGAIGGFNELALTLAGEERQFPSMVILNEQQQMITKIPGFYMPEDVRPMLEFFRNNLYVNKTYGEFRKEYEKNKLKQ